MWLYIINEYFGSMVARCVSLYITLFIREMIHCTKSPSRLAKRSLWFERGVPLLRVIASGTTYILSSKDGKHLLLYLDQTPDVIPQVFLLNQRSLFTGFAENVDSTDTLRSAWRTVVIYRLIFSLLNRCVAESVLNEDTVSLIKTILVDTYCVSTIHATHPERWKLNTAYRQVVFT
jgi:hypothetical protein